MQLLFSITPPDLIRAINWTLIHSLWQGVLLSVITGGIVFFTKRASPLLRYNLFTLALLIFVITVGITFIVQINKADEGVTNLQITPVVKTISAELPLQLHPAEHKLPVTEKAFIFFNENAGSIVFAWLLYISLQFVRLTAGLYGVYRLKRKAVYPAGEYWNNRLTELCRQLQMNRRVRLLQSGVAGMPAAIGFFKPVILFPAAMLASLPADEIEAVLLHELAHIRRRDFVVNLLQSVIEIIFFFNPAVWWVSSLIKAERENCCDDIAVAQSESKQHYIKALLSFQQFGLPYDTPLINAFGGEKNHLMNRVKRIIYNNNKTLNNMEKKFLAAGIVVTSVFIFAFSANNTTQKKITHVVPSVEINFMAGTKTLNESAGLTDTVPLPEAIENRNSNERINTTVNGKKYSLVTKDEQVIELYENGKKIPAEKMPEYKNITGKLLTELKLEKEMAEKDMAESEAAMVQSKKEMEEAVVEMEWAKKEMAEAEKQMEIDVVQAKKDIEKSKLDLAQSNIEMKKAKIEMEQAEKEMRKDMEQAKREFAQAKKDIEQSRKDIAQSKREVEQSEMDIAQSKKDLAQSNREMMLAKKDIEHSKLLRQQIVEDMIDANVIKDKNGLTSYKLNNDELIVNGVKQPEDIFKRFKDKYVKNNNQVMEYNKQ